MAGKAVEPGSVMRYPAWMTPPMLAISGWSGAGKTTLIETLIPRLVLGGLRVGVLKHDAHGLELDRPGKDTMRMREAGAARVEALDGRWWFQVAPAPTASGPPPHARAWRNDVDLLLVEGGKSSDLDKIWLLGPDGRRPPAGTSSVILEVERGPGAVEAAETCLVGWLEDRWRERPRAAVVISGDAAHVPAAFFDAVLGAVRPVPDVPGPAGQMLAALRWAPGHTWLVLDSRRPLPDLETIEWLWSERRPGIWAVVCSRDDLADPYYALYEPQAVHVLEEAAPGGTQELARVLDGHPQASLVEPPHRGPM